MQSDNKGTKFISQNLLIDESIARGIKVTHVNKDQNSMVFYELSYKKHIEYISGGIISKMSAVANHCVTNKYLTKILLKKEKINVPEGKIFSKKNISQISLFIKKIGYPIVIKKNNGARGDLVFLGVNSKENCKKAISCIFKKHKDILIEKEFKGKEFRFIVSRKKVFAVTEREPANVIGDGVHSIRELIEIKNKSRKTAIVKRCLFKIKINNILRKRLKENKLRLNSIVSKEKKIYLRDDNNKNSMIINGGDDVDVTDQVHPELKKIAVRAVKAIPGLTYTGLDLMTSKNISEKPTKNSYVIIELNSFPAIYPQHFPSQGKPRNVAKEIIDILFPETKGKYNKK